MYQGLKMDQCSCVLSESLSHLIFSLILNVAPACSRIPGHWVQPPPPADEVWASYLVQPK